MKGIESSIQLSGTDEGEVGGVEIGLLEPCNL